MKKGQYKPLPPNAPIHTIMRLVYDERLSIKQFSKYQLGGMSPADIEDWVQVFRRAEARQV